MPVLPTPIEMETAFRARDASYDGVFYLGVRTTGIFCRPSCPARKPLSRNVEYFATVKEALFAGYRPCERCRPLEAVGEPPPWVRRLLALLDADPTRRLSDHDLRRNGIDPARARRYFSARYGMTFQTFARGRRLGLALNRIREGGSLDQVAFRHGYESHSGFRDAFARWFGAPPGKAPSTAAVSLAWIESPLGPLLAGAAGDAVCLLEFTDRRMLEPQLLGVRRRFRASIVPGTVPVLERLRGELVEYFGGARRSFSVPLVHPGTDFQVRVWQKLREIPYGGTCSYEALAAAVGSPGASRAVGRANGLNRIAIVIPCHRVVNKSGELGGYGGGLWRKRRLLELEAAAAQTMGSAAPQATQWRQPSSTSDWHCGQRGVV